jgi:ankyrin repeat protein
VPDRTPRAPDPPPSSRGRGGRSRGRRRRRGPPRVKDVGRWTHVLFSAAERGDAETVSRLFDDGCPVDLQDPTTGDTALLRACRSGRPAVARLCIARGGALDPHPEFGLTALQAAVDAAQFECLRVVLEAVAAAAQAEARASEKRRRGGGPEARAASAFTSDAETGSVAMSAGSVAMSAVPEARAAEPGRAARDSGVSGVSDLGVSEREADAARRALEAAVNQAVTGGGVRGFSVHIAAGGGDPQILDELLRHNANPELLDAAMRTPLHVAASAGRLGCLQLLLQTPSAADALLEATDHEGLTALHCAARSGSLPCVRLLLQTAADPLRRDAGGMRPQDHAEKGGHDACLALLREYSGDKEPLRERSGSVEACLEASDAGGGSAGAAPRGLLGRPAAASKPGGILKKSAGARAAGERAGSAAPAGDASRGRATPGAGVSGGPAMSEEEMCVICREQPKDTALLPCGHRCCCYGCANVMLFRAPIASPRSSRPRCPICRAAIQTVARIYG